MDPDAALAELLDLARAGETAGLHPDDANRLADGFLELHDWLEKGGYPPAAWRHGHSAAEVGGE